MASALFKKLLERVPKETEEEVHRSMALAIRMHKLMRKHGISQVELAQMTDEHEDKITRWLSGIYSFTTTDLAKVQTLLDKFPLSIPKKDKVEKFNLKNRILAKQQLFAQKYYNNSSDIEELIRTPQKNHEIIVTGSSPVNSRAPIPVKSYENL